MSGALLLLLLCATPTSTAAASLPGPGLAAGAQMPTWRMPVVNAAHFGAKQVDLREFYRGGPRSNERVLVTFAASWCAPCKRELTALSEARERLASAGARVVVIVADETAEGRTAIVRWLTDDLAVPFAVIVDDMGILRRRYLAQALPATFLADAQGRLQWAKAGYEEGSIEALLTVLTRP